MRSAKVAKEKSYENGQQKKRDFLEKRRDILDAVSQKIEESISEGLFFCRVSFEKTVISEEEYSLILSILTDDNGYIVSRNYSYCFAVVFDIYWGNI